MLDVSADTPVFVKLNYSLYNVHKERSSSISIPSPTFLPGPKPQALIPRPPFFVALWYELICSQAAFSELESHLKCFTLQIFRSYYHP